MYSKRPVIAADSGGPLESVSHDRTGYLCKPQPEVFATALQSLVMDKNRAAAMGEAGRAHVLEKFSLDTFQAQLSKVCEDRTGGGERTNGCCVRMYMLLLPVLLCLCFFMLVVNQLL